MPRRNRRHKSTIKPYSDADVPHDINEDKYLKQTEKALKKRLRNGRRRTPKRRANTTPPIFNPISSIRRERSIDYEHVPISGCNSSSDETGSSLANSQLLKHSSLVKMNNLSGDGEIHKVRTIVVLKSIRYSPSEEQSPPPMSEDALNSLSSGTYSESLIEEDQAVVLQAKVTVEGNTHHTSEEMAKILQGIINKTDSTNVELSVPIKRNDRNPVYYDLNEMLWLEFNAVLLNTDVVTADNFIERKRVQELQTVIDEVNRYTFHPIRSMLPGSATLQTPSTGDSVREEFVFISKGASPENDFEVINPADLRRSISGPNIVGASHYDLNSTPISSISEEHSFELTPSHEYLKTVRMAYEEASDLVSRMHDYVSEYFQSWKAFRDSTTVLRFDDNTSRRLEDLTLWCNLVEQLSESSFLLSQLVEAKKHKVSWPLVIQTKHSDLSFSMSLDQSLSYMADDESLNYSFEPTLGVRKDVSIFKAFCRSALKASTMRQIFTRLLRMLHTTLKHTWIAASEESPSEKESLSDRLLDRLMRCFPDEKDQFRKEIEHIFFPTRQHSKCHKKVESKSTVMTQTMESAFSEGKDRSCFKRDGSVNSDEIQSAIDENLKCCGRFSRSTCNEFRLPSLLPIYQFLLRSLWEISLWSLRDSTPFEIDGPMAAGTVIMCGNECKTLLRHALFVIFYYTELMKGVLETEKEKQDLEERLRAYENEIENTFERYKRLLLRRLEIDNLGFDHDEEWKFVMSITPFISRRESLGGLVFCELSKRMLEMARDAIVSKTESIFDFLQDSSFVASRHELSSSFDADQDNDNTLIVQLRELKNVFYGSNTSYFKVHLTKSLRFVKLMMKDLLIASNFFVTTSTCDLFGALKETSHLLLDIGNSIPPNYRIFVSQGAKHKPDVIIHMLTACISRSYYSLDKDYLLIFNTNGEDCKWDGECLQLDCSPTALYELETLEFDGLLFVVCNSALLLDKASSFHQLMVPHLAFSQKQTSQWPRIADWVKEIRDLVFSLITMFSDTISKAQEALKDYSTYKKPGLQIPDILETIYMASFEVIKEADRLIGKDNPAQIAHKVIEFAEMWANYVLKFRGTGNGTTPRWANFGIEFFRYACAAGFLQNLTEQQFQAFRDLMDMCINHVIGSPNQDINCNSIYSSQSSLISQSRNTICDHISLNDNHLLNAFPFETHSADELSPDVSAKSSVHEYEEGEKSKMEQIRQSIQRLECYRHEELQKKKIIGRVPSGSQRKARRENPYKVKFNWVLGRLIGSTNYSKVYECHVKERNLTMAVKKIDGGNYCENEVNRIYEEIDHLTALNHRNVVKYYGMDSHQNKISIFMEYCTLGDLAGTYFGSQNQDVDELQLRYYIFQLVNAVNYVHEQGIVHSDIKGENLFLTGDQDRPVLKLGDFGAAFIHRTNENFSFRTGDRCQPGGTLGFQAPELWRNQQQSLGPPVDIWSIGSVMIQLITGKNPLRLNTERFDYQQANIVMFNLVQNKMSPGLPAHYNVSREAREFINYCHTYDHDERPTAALLLKHGFLSSYHPPD